MLDKFEWVGLTDLMDVSLCLLHYQAGGALPAECQCSAGKKLSLGLPRFNHGVKRHDPSSLDGATLEELETTRCEKRRAAR